MSVRLTKTPREAGAEPTCSRRELLAGLAALSLLPGPRSGPRRLILVWLDGGASHIDTFDGKPEAGVHIRGDLGSRTTPIDGVFFSDRLPRLAERLPRCALVRSITHGEGNHDRGSHLLLTGRRPSPVLVHPSLPAAVTHAAPPTTLPPFVAIPDAPQYGGAGFLPASAGPFEVGGDPGRAEFSVRGLGGGGDRRQHLRLLATLDRLDGAPRSPAERERDAFVQQALAMRSDPEVSAAFDLAREPAAVRERYGRHRLGQSCLLARRLVRAGARTVLVRDTGWDHHQRIARALGYGFPAKLDALDQAVPALLDDLEDGDGDTVVCVASEFGRTPRLNPSAGRDHWPRAQSVLLYGAGIARGVVFGSTDARGEEPASDACTPADLFATLVHALRADATTILHTPDGRPVRLVPEGATVLTRVLA
ncbi:MAG: DUF1501 domain-containing protein [Planctomycetota bacterium]